MNQTFEIYRRLYEMRPDLDASWPELPTLEYLLELLKPMKPRLMYDAEGFENWIAFPKDDDGLLLRIDPDPLPAVLKLTIALIEAGLMPEGEQNEHR